MIKKFLLRLSLNPGIIKLCEKLYKALLICTNVHIADMLLFISSRLLFSSPGLTFTRYGYYNPYAYNFIWNVQEEYRLCSRDFIIKPKRKFQEEKRLIRIGIFGNLAVPNKDFFKKYLDDWEVFYYDLQDVMGYRAAWLEKKGNYDCALLDGNPIENAPERQGWNGYRPITRQKFSYISEINNLASSINGDELDVILHIGGISKSWDELVDLIDVPIILNYATGSIVSFNNRVTLDFFSQPQLYYKVQGDHVYCDILQRRISSVRAKEIRFAFNHRDIKITDNIPLSQRDKQIVFWGNLYKLNNVSVLKVISKILHNNSDYKFVFFGPEQQNELKRIFSFFSKEHLSSRIIYLGRFENYPDKNGLYNNNSWKNMLNVARKSKLFIDAWPICGGNSVFQAYMLGIPCVSMGLVEDEHYRIKKDKTSVAINGLNIDLATAHSIEEYKRICEEILCKDSVAERVVNMQYERVEELCDYSTIWDAIEAVVNQEGDIGRD